MDKIESTKTENQQSLIHPEPFTKSDLRALIDLLRNNDLSTIKTVSPRDITRKDIISYAYSRLMAYFLEKATQAVQNFDIQTQPLEILSEKLKEIVLDLDTIPDGIPLTQTQRATLEQGISLFIEDIAIFHSLLPAEKPETYIRKHLGPRFQNLPDHSFTIDYTSYPGSIVLLFNSRRYYEQVAPPDSEGVYNENLGQEFTFGRILLVYDGSINTSSIVHHEYLHFLQKKLLSVHKTKPKKARLENELSRKLAPIDEKLLTLSSEKDDLLQKKYTELSYTGKVSDALRKKIADISQGIQSITQKKDQVSFFVHESLSSYPDPEIQKAFEKVKRELQAYAVANNQLPNSFVADTLGKGFTESLSQSTQGSLFLRELGILKETLRLATTADLAPQELGFLVSSARTLTEASKFVYLHYMQAPRRYTSDEIHFLKSIPKAA